MTTGAEIISDAVALITLARTEEHPELLVLALDHLMSREGETLRDSLTREAQLIATLASFSAALIEALDGLAPGRIDAVIQRLALAWAEKLADEE